MLIMIGCMQLKPVMESLIKERLSGKDKIEEHNRKKEAREAKKSAKWRKKY